MNRGSSGGIMGKIIGGIISLIMIGGVLAFFRLNNISDVSTFVSFFRAKAPQVEQCYKNKGLGCTNKIVDDNKASSSPITSDSAAEILSNSQLHYSGPTKGQPFINDSIKRTKDSMISKVDSIKSAASDVKAKAQFNIKDYPHFLPTSNSCWSTQNSTLVNQAVPNTIKLLDNYRKVTKDVNKACSIKSGQWIDSYTGKKINKQKDVSLDYVVTLRYAHNHGAYKWTSKQKSDFANDQDNLMTVTNDSKKSRDSKAPEKWSPKGNKEACIFGKAYTNILSKYSLSASDKDKTALSRDIMKCNE